MTNGTVFSGWFEPSRPSPSRTNFRAKIRNKQGNQKMADSLSILLALELLDDYEVEISEVLDEDDDITLFSVGSSYMRRNLNRVRDYFEGTIPLYFPDEFKGHFRMTRETCELFTRAVMPTGRIPLGNGSGRAAIPTRLRCKSGAKEHSSHLSHNNKRNTDIEQKNWKPC